MNTHNWKAILQRNVVLAGLISLFNDLGSQMIFPLIPLFLANQLGAAPSIIGLVEGAAEGMAAFVKMLSGYWSDKLSKRKPFIVIGYLFSAVLRPLFMIANSWLFVFFLRSVERIGKGLRNAPRDAYIAESVPEHLQGKAFGLQRAMDGIGSVLGAMLGYFLVKYYTFSEIFFFAIIPGIFSVGAALFFEEKDTTLSLSMPKANEKTKEKPHFSPMFYAALGAISLFSMGHFGYALLMLRSKELGFSQEETMLFYILFYWVYVGISLVGGWLADRWGKMQILALSYAVHLLLCLYLYVSNQNTLIWFSFVLYGIFYGLSDGVQRAYIADISPKKFKATAMGMYHMVIGLVALLAGYGIGKIWEIAGHQIAFGFAGLFTVLGIIGILITHHAHKTDTPNV